MMSAVANKQMYDSLARVMLKQGQVFKMNTQLEPVKKQWK
jgi:membrane-bound lytic murein transglycosylase